MEQTFKVLDLDWQESFNVQYDRKLNKYHIDSIPSDLLEKHGIYQIYGRHPVYGQNVLLYIGETKESLNGERSFKARLLEHIKGRFFYYTNLSISLCPLLLPDDEIIIAESILISTHKPALNYLNFESTKDTSKGYLVRNWGFMRSLQSECSGCYFHQPEHKYTSDSI